MTYLTMFKANEPDVVSETVDGETIAVNLSTGAYYSFGGCASEAWNLIISGYSLEQILERLEKKFNAYPSIIADDLEQLIKQLEAEQLISRNNDASLVVETSEASITSNPTAYEPPVIEKFNDMQEILLLDPIHEVDPAQGWPTVKATEV